jgi:hypothetical protein
MMGPTTMRAMHQIMLSVAKSPSEALALTNCVILHPDDAKKITITTSGNDILYTLICSKYLLAIR